jgi:DNA-binding LytR/AlgR family response regulator
MTCSIVAESIEKSEHWKSLINQHGPAFEISSLFSYSELTDCSEIRFQEVVFMQPLPDISRLMSHLSNEDFICPVIIFCVEEGNPLLKRMDLSAMEKVIFPMDLSSYILLDRRVQRLLEIRKKYSPVAKGWKTALKHYLEDSIAENCETIVLPDVNGNRIIKKSTILKLESDGDLAVAYLTDGERVDLYKPIAHFEWVLDEKDFMRLNHHQMVNLDCICSWQREGQAHAMLTDGAKIPITMRSIPLFLERMNARLN